MSSQFMAITTNQTMINQIGKLNVLLRELLNYNPNWTISFLTEKAANIQVNVEHTFVPHYTLSNFKYSDAEIEIYLKERFEQELGMDNISMNTKNIALKLAEHIYALYLEKFSKWSYWGEESVRLIIEISDNCILDDNNIIVWSSFGVITGKKVIKVCAHELKLSGSPEINMVKINSNKLNELVVMLENKGLEFVKNWTDNEERKCVLKQEGYKHLY